MSVGYILERAGQKMGLSPRDNAQRQVLLGFLNEAADELYAQSDMPNSMYEQVFKVNGDNTISLPSYVGYLRAAREFYTMRPWHINTMRPRYNTANWKDMWRNYRIVGHKAIQRTLVNQAQLVITVAAVENPPIMVTLRGATEDAQSVVEVVTMDAISKQTTNNWLDLEGAQKDRVNSYNVVISDIDEVEISMISNDQLEANYLIVDVSLLPFSANSNSQQDHWVEILYKKTLPWLKNDGDEFPAKGYDNVLVNKMAQLWAEQQEKVELAGAYDAKATRSLARKTENENRATEDQVCFQPNPHDQLNCRITRGPNGRYASIYGPYGMGN